MKIALGLVGLLAVVGGCKKEGQDPPGGSPIAASSTDALWAFAPADPQVALVAADGSLAPLHAAALRVIADLEKAPGGAAIVQKIREPIAGAPFDPIDPKSLANVGIDLAKGFAYFKGATGEIAVLPLSDPKKFLAMVKGTSEGGVDRFGSKVCKSVVDRYVCADSTEALDAAAKGGGQSQVAGWPSQMRGHIEIFASAQQMSGAPVTDGKGLRVGATFERGAATVRVHLVGTPAGPFALVRGGKTSLVSGLADQQPSALMVLNAVKAWEAQKAQVVQQAAGAPPLPGGVNAGELAGSVRGDMVGYALPGLPLRGLARVGLTNETPMKQLLGACNELASQVPPGVTLAGADGRCSVTVDPKVLAPDVPGMPTMKLDAWVEGGNLVLGLGDHAAKATARPGLAPFAREILDGDHILAAWGQGSLAGGPLLATKEQLDAMRAQDPTGGLAVWAIHHLSEFGIAVRVGDDGIHGALRVRTLWANPDAVVTAVQAAIAEFAGGKVEALETLKKIAEQHPDTPFAHDVQSGPAGLMAPMAAAGILAAISIPAFVKYRTRSEEMGRAMEARELGVPVEPPAEPLPPSEPTPPVEPPPQ